MQNHEEYKGPANLPEKLKELYENFKLVSETSTFKLYEATQAVKPKAKHLIRVLDSNTNDYIKKNYPQLTALFIQELLHLQSLHPGSVITKSFGISEEKYGKQIFCATLPYKTLTSLGETFNFKDFKTMTKLTEDIVSDTVFLLRELGMKDVIKTLGVRNIGYFKEENKFILTNWAAGFETLSSVPEKASQSTYLSTIPVQKKSGLSFLDLATELKSLGLGITRLNNIDTKNIESLLSIVNFDPEALNAAVKAIISKPLKESNEMQDLITELLTADFQTLSCIKKLKIPDIHVAISKNVSQMQKDQNLLAWCTYGQNEVTIIDWHSKEVYTKFQGPTYQESWNQIHGVPNSSLMCSLSSDLHYVSSTIQIFDISQRGKSRVIFAENAEGYSDILAFNSKRNLIGALSVEGSVAYHLFSIIDVNYSTSSEIAKVSRKERWHSQYSTQTDNYISDLDFNPEGTRAATIDSFGVCLISNVNDGKYLCHLDIGDEGFGLSSLLRWKPISSDRAVYVKYQRNLLNVFDVEKKVLTLKKPIKLEQFAGVTSSMEVCPINDNYLAAAGEDKNIKIIDFREWRIAKTFENIHKGRIKNIKWSSKGDMLATGSHDCMAKVIEFKTGKVLYTGQHENEAITSVFFS